MDRLFILVAGAALLAGQVSWSRLATVPLGGSFASGMITLSAAMAGLGLGSYFSGRARIRLLVPVCAAILALAPTLILTLPRSLTAAFLLLAHAPFGMVLPCVAGRRPASSYALSALGGVLGAMGLSEILAPNWGYDTIGLLLAAAILLTGLPVAISSRSDAAPTEPRPAPRRDLALAALLGFLGLLAESLWLQLFGFYWEANAETFGLVIAASIGGVSLGSAFGRRVPLWLGAGGLALAAMLSPIALQAFTFAERLVVTALLVGLPAAGVGATFARLLSRDSFPLLAAANAAGAAAAPLLLGLTSTWVGWPARALVGVACGYGLLAGRKPWALIGIVAVALMPGLPPTEAYLDGTGIPFARTGVESTVAVTRDARSGVDILWIDRGFQGDTSPLGRRIPAALGTLPGELLGRTPRRALAIGLGMGVTLSRISAESLEVAELSRGVIEANRTLLADVNGRVLERPGLTVHHADGRRVLADAPDPYDLIVVDMMFPTVAGAGNLYSREFYALARRRLTDDGLFVHWLPGFLLAPEDLAAIAAAFLESFPEGSAWIGYADPERLVLGLAGGRTAGSDRSRLLLSAAQLRRLAGEAAPLRDADPRLEIRSNRRGETGFGRANLQRLLELAEGSVLGMRR